MNNIEFLNEALQYQYCPSNFQEVYLEFCRYQKLAIDALKAFASVCEKNNILYHLAWGSLLGAMRDHGQIPWDYDVDVFIHFEDRYSLINALDNDLDSGYYYTCGELHNCKQFFIRVAPKNYPTDVIHVDVFYYIGLPDKEKERRKYSSKLIELFLARKYKTCNLDGSVNHKIRIIILKIKYCLIARKKLEKMIVRKCEKYNSYESKLCTGCDSSCGSWYYPIEYIKDTTFVEIDSRTYMIPARYVDILNLNYGDYKSYFPIDTRIKEVLASYSRIVGELKK